MKGAIGGKIFCMGCRVQVNDWIALFRWRSTIFWQNYEVMIEFQLELCFNFIFKWFGFKFNLISFQFQLGYRSVKSNLISKGCVMVLFTLWKIEIIGHYSAWVQLEFDLKITKQKVFDNSSFVKTFPFQWSFLLSKWMKFS